MLDSADAIARVIEEIQQDRFRASDPQHRITIERLRPCFDQVVDITPVYRDIVDKHQPFNPYERFSCIAPPWSHATLAFQTRFGNVVASTLLALDAEKGEVDQTPFWDTENDVDWARVRWRLILLVWVGGYSITENRPIATTGPIWLEEHAVYDDGSPADLHWTQIVDYWTEDNARVHEITNLAALTLLNCSNVTAQEPRRYRAQARRLARVGLRLSTIHVHPVRRTGGSEGVPLGEGSPLTSVRGHFAKYGPKYDRKLLFGRHEGMFYRPQHVRGKAEAGVIEHSYVVHPDA